MQAQYEYGQMLDKQENDRLREFQQREAPSLVITKLSLVWVEE